MMVEDIKPTDGAPVYEEPVEPKSGLAAYASTKRGKLVLGGVGLVVVLAAIGAALFLFVLQPETPSATESLVPPAGAAPAPTTTEVSAEESATAPETEPLSSTFVFRDIFSPSSKPSIVPAGTSSSGGNDSDSGDNASSDSSSTGDSNDQASNDVPADTLMLQSVSTQDGEPVATFLWNGQTYTVGEGDQLGDTPWEVVDISGDTVVLLYGDSRVTLTVGQGVTK